MIGVAVGPAVGCVEVSRSYRRTGTSDAASLIEQKIEDFLKHSWEPRLQVLEPEIMSLVGADREDLETARVTEETASKALAFVLQLPRSMPVPEVAADPDGEISLDWIGNTGKMFSVSIGADGRISYAGRFDDKSKTHGAVQLSETFPQEILVGIERAIR